MWQRGLFTWNELSGPVVAGITREEGGTGYSNFRLVVLKEVEKRRNSSAGCG
ncbi:hypothetical protein [Desulfofundulus thermocisternus]|uniref:hypothetical protein n=1 Tax=Desulfofundulus thermocisternus TaxID=42471 RepID=UPI00217D1DFF|nr:hypothetical protein [Desulfofundulus thermocisternus]